MYHLAKYATATTIYFSMIKRGVVDLAQTADWTPATGDTKISINGGTLANTTNNPAIVAGTNGVKWSLALTSGECTGANIEIQIVDSATKAVEDQSLTVYTYGNASAKLVADNSVAAFGAVMPTTAGRTLDVAATGEAGIDLDNILLTNGAPKAAIVASGTLSGTHSTTTADLGTNAPSQDIGGCVLSIPTRGVYNPIDSYNTSTGVATFSPALASNTLTDADVWLVYPGSRASTGAPPTVLLSSGTGTGQLDFTSGVVKANLAQILGTALTETAGLIAAGFKQFFNIASPTSTMNTITTTTTATNLTNAPTAGDLTATMKTSVATAALTTAMTESYAADGATMTLAQACYLIAQTIGDFSVSGTTVTVKKVDGSTTAATYTLDSATVPTSRTRAT